MKSFQNSSTESSQSSFAPSNPTQASSFAQAKGFMQASSAQASLMKGSPASSAYVQPAFAQTDLTRKQIVQEKAALLLQEYAKGKRIFTRAVLRGSGLYIVAPGLEEADLSRACLFQINLTQANLQGCNFTRTQLRMADLTAANLGSANLRGADLCRADLSHAILRNACLVAANLSDAKLVGADLTGADLRSANLSCTDLRNAIFSQTLMPDGTVRNS